MDSMRFKGGPSTRFSGREAICHNAKKSNSIAIVFRITLFSMILLVTKADVFNKKRYENVSKIRSNYQKCIKQTLVVF
jgi:hypothetical protein